MTIVVADTSPIHYLVQLDGVDLLPALYGQLLLPAAVVRELQHPSAAPMVLKWLANLPVWASLRPPISNPDTSLFFLDPGEREAIQMAEETRPSLLLIDEKTGRREAARRRLQFTGTLGVLAAADKIGAIDGLKAYERLLAETSFRSSALLRERFLKELGKKRLG